MMRETLDGAGVGAAAGLVIGMVGELAVFVTRLLLPTDVAIVGFAVYSAVPAGALVGAVCGWRGWLPNRARRAIASAIPGVLVGAVAVFMQWSAL